MMIVVIIKLRSASVSLLKAADTSAPKCNIIIIIFIIIVIAIIIIIIMMVKMMMRGRGAISEECALGRLAGPSPGESSGEELLTLCYTNLLEEDGGNVDNDDDDDDDDDD